MGEITAVVGYLLVVVTLWWAPLYAWFLFVSGWARRAPFLWAVLPPLGLAVAARIAFGTKVLGDLITSRLFGAYQAALVMPQHPAPNTVPNLGIDQIDVAKFASSPGLWFGLLAAAGLIAATVWMRCRRELV